MGYIQSIGLQRVEHNWATITFTSLFFSPGILGEYLWGNIFQPTTKGNELYEWLCDCSVGG